ncbi:uncharacterized protein V6R79_004808 [Siganus canaliculatus]
MTTREKASAENKCIEKPSFITLSRCCPPVVISGTMKLPSSPAPKTTSMNHQFRGNSERHLVAAELNTTMSTPEAGGTAGGPGAGEGEGGPAAAAPNLTSNRRLQQTQAQVDEVVDIMRVNVDKVLERDQKLSELDDRADALQAGASQFESSAAKLKNKYWWKNCKFPLTFAPASHGGQSEPCQAFD